MVRNLSNSNTDLGDTNAENVAVKSSSTQEHQIYKVHLMWAMFTGTVVVFFYDGEEYII